MDLGKSCPDRFCSILGIRAAEGVLRVRTRSRIARTRADFDRFSEMSENRENWMVEQKGFELATPSPRKREESFEGKILTAKMTATGLDKGG